MSELARRLIADEHTRHAGALTAIEQAGGLIAEAETIAATLRSHGIKDARANGFVGAGMPSKVYLYVMAGLDVSPEALLQALRDADLPIGWLDIGSESFSDIHLHGLDVAICVERDVALAIAATLRKPAHRPQPSQEPAHA